MSTSSASCRRLTRSLTDLRAIAFSPAPVVFDPLFAACRKTSRPVPILQVARDLKTCLPTEFLSTELRTATTWATSWATSWLSARGLRRLLPEGAARRRRCVFHQTPAANSGGAGFNGRSPRPLRGLVPGGCAPQIQTVQHGFVATPFTIRLPLTAAALDLTDEVRGGQGISENHKRSLR